MEVLFALLTSLGQWELFFYNPGFMVVLLTFSTRRVITCTNNFNLLYQCHIFPSSLGWL